MYKKYLFFDIDGTLTDNNPGGNIPESVHRTLKKLVDNNYFVAIATGRSYTLVQDAMRETGIHNVVCNGGNGLVVDGKLQYILPLDRQKALIVLHECLDKDIPFVFAINDSHDAYGYDDRFKALIPGRDFLDLHILDQNQKLEDFEEFHKLYIGLSLEEENKLDSRKLLGYARYWPTWMIIEPDDKYRGIKDMVTQLGGKEEDIVVFGDGYNDVSMCQKAAMSIAMGNAIEPLKEIATFVTKDNKHDGIEYACKHFGWID